MVTEMLSRAQAVDPQVLSEVVRKDLNDPGFVITGWSVDPLSNQGFMNPDGLFLFQGQGLDGAGPRAWSVVVKLLHPGDFDHPPTSVWYWKREALVAQTGLCDQLPGPVKAPRFYRMDEAPDAAWIWMEHIRDERPGQWQLEDFCFAAHQLGKFDGAIAVSGQPFDQPWLTRDQLRTWYSEADPAIDMQFPLNQKHITGKLLERYLYAWDRRQALYDALEALPTYFAHFDCMRRNLMVRTGKAGQPELVLLDWANCGLAPLGSSLFNLVGFSTMFMGWPSHAITELAAAAYPSYLAGLREAGWTGEEETVRLAYLVWMSVWWGITMPNMFSKWCTPEASAFVTQMFGAAGEEIMLIWLNVFAYSMGCAEEALEIIRRSGGTR